MDSLFVSDCEDEIEICLDINPMDISNFEITDNGNPYAGNFGNCQPDSLITYQYVAVLEGSPDGPYGISWIVNGQTFTAEVDEFATLVDSLNSWDPSGAWIDDGTLQTLSGGFAGNVYGAISVELLSQPGVPVVVLQPIILTIYNGASIFLDSGDHQVSIFDKTNGCIKDYLIFVGCPEDPGTSNPDTVYTEVPICLTDTICLEVKLPGTILSIQNICENASGQFADIVLLGDSSCVEITGEAIGQDTACIVICDDLGNCDTTILVVTITPPHPDTVEYTIIVGQDSTHCLDLSELCGTVLSITEICGLDGIIADFTLNDVTNCIEFTGLEEGSDTACIVICDALACDTIVIIVNVNPSFGIPPVAVNDTTSANENRTRSINVLANDTINGILVNGGIINGPVNGTITGTLPGLLTYTPNVGFCGAMDSFTYFIENEFGRDTATVYIDVICRDLTIYTGFSPNGDGVNDVFIIDGIDDYPNNEVLVFNRWGNQVFSMKSYSNDQAWDGRWDGNDLPDGTYFYIIDDGEGNTYSGYVQIHR
jgi:gliding motility-associated-like protein